MTSVPTAIDPAAEQALPDAGEPQGALDDRPAMLGKRFRRVIAGAMLTGLVVALVAHALLQSFSWYGYASGWSWIVVALGGLAVGGAFGLFLYGVSTDRSDAGLEPHGRADVSEQGEWRRTLQRRRSAHHHH
jgi:hypothetical protein